MTAELLNNFKIFLLFVSFISLIFFFIFLTKDFLNTEKPKKKKERSTSLNTYTNNKYAEESMKRREYRVQLVEKFRKEKIKKLTSNAKQEVNNNKTTQDEMESLRAAWKREKENRIAFENEKREKNLN